MREVIWNTAGASRMKQSDILYAENRFEPLRESLGTHRLWIRKILFYQNERRLRSFINLRAAS
jgi:hypothetical protein